MLILQSSGLLPFILLAGASSPPHSCSHISVMLWPWEQPCQLWEMLPCLGLIYFCSAAGENCGGLRGL